MHAMTFWWGTTIDELVIHGVNAKDGWGMFLLCIALVGLCLLYEAMKYQQARVRLATMRDRFKMIACQPPNESATLLTAAELSQQRIHMQVQHSAAVASSSSSSAQPPPPPRIIFQDPAPRQRLVQLGQEALIFLFQAVLGYFLMLAVMSYNGPIFLAVVLGMAFGYFLFGHFTMGLNMQTQQLSHTTFTCSTNCPNGESNPPAFAFSNPIASSATAPHSATRDENQNLSLKKLQSVAEAIVDQQRVDQQPAAKASCCSA